MNVLITDAAGNHALSTVRSLGRRGLSVAVGDSTWTGKALYSRHCAARFHYPSPASGLSAFETEFCRHLERLRPCVLMPMTERTILGISGFRARVEALVEHLPLAPAATLETVFDKTKTLRLAESLGVPVPRTVLPTGVEHAASLADSLAYPVVVKPRSSEMITTDHRVLSTGAVRYCYEPGALASTFAAVHARAPLPMVQEFVPGEGFGVSMLYNRGALRAVFAHRRLRMVRPTGSGSALREGIEPPPAMLASARRLLEALNWHGVAMVEFKLDPRDGVPRLMEINGRFWNSLPLAVASGVDFPFLLYELAVEGDCETRLDYEPGVQARWLVGDLRHLVEVFRGRPAGWTDAFPARWPTLKEFCRFMGPRLAYDVVSLSDPLPFIADVAGLVRQMGQAAFGRPPAGRGRVLVVQPDVKAGAPHP